jgi:hypothetical protein
MRITRIVSIFATSRMATSVENSLASYYMYNMSSFCHADSYSIMETLGAFVRRFYHTPPQLLISASLFPILIPIQVHVF